MKRKFIVLAVMGVMLLSLSLAAQAFQGFTYNQLLDHFRYYHERSECIYQGDGSWGNIEVNILHPQPRDSSRRAQGYMRAYTMDPNPVYTDRAHAAMEWLLTDQNADGHFTWWCNPDGVNDIFGCQYETGEGASALAEGYATYGDVRYLQASERAAVWEENLEFGWNTNYVLFNVWHLAKHYRITGNTRWLDAAVYKVQNCAFPRQDTDGGWLEGSGAPTDLLGHNKREWYHSIILRGLIELYRVLPTNHPIRTQLFNSIQAGVNRLYTMQITSGEIVVGAGVPNEHRDAFGLEALLMAQQYCGIDTTDCIRGIMQYRMDFSQPPYQMPDYTPDLQSVGYLMQRYSVVVPNPPSEPTPPTMPPSPVVANPNFEGDGGFFNLATGWLSYGFGKREAFSETGHGWVAGLCDYPQGKSDGIYQIIAGATVGTSYRLSADVRVTNSQIGGSVGAVGIQTHDKHVATFSSETTSTSWVTKTIDFTATSPYITIFLQGRNTSPYAISFDRALFDNVTLVPTTPVPASIVLNPTSLTPTTTQGSNAPAGSFTVRNGGSGTINYTISDNSSWLSETPTSGDSSGETDTITVNYTTSGLTAGTYNATITVTAAGVSNSPQTIPVTLTVTSGGSGNILMNSDFEGSYNNDPDVDHKTAISWHGVKVAGNAKWGGWYGSAHGGDWSQGCWEGSCTTAFYQQATNAISGNSYTASAWVKGSNTSLNFWIGIDPTGGTSPTSANVQWSAMSTPNTTWTQISKQVTASSSTITVFVKTQNTSGNNYYSYIDDATCVNNGGGSVGTISGNVKDGGGANLSGATVATNTGGYTTTTDASGNYTLSNVATGTYDVTASKTGYNSQTQAGKVVTSNTTTTANFTCTRQTGTLTGNVKNSGGTNLSGATVSTNTGGYSATTDTNGNYTISSVVTGTYDVTAAKSGYNSQTQTGKTVSNGATTTVNFTLSTAGSTGTITGNVKNMDGVNISGATVSTNTGGYTTTTNSSGNYTLSNVAAGTYNVTAAKSGFVSQVQNGISVTSNQTTTCNFTALYVASQDFSAVPTWTTSDDASWGGAATFSSVTGGQSGNFLQASRTTQGSSAKVLVYTVPTNTTLTVSVYLKCPSYASSYWMESACKLGNNSANDFNNNSGTWTYIKKFANDGTNGNSNTWTKYSVTVSTGSSTQISIGYKHGASGNNGPTVGWDTFLTD